MLELNQLDLFDKDSSTVNWVKTSDRLPPIGDWVLTVHVFASGQYRSIGIAYLFDYNAKTNRPQRLNWQYQPIKDQLAVPLSEVSHWAALPALPEEKC